MRSNSLLLASLSSMACDRRDVKFPGTGERRIKEEGDKRGGVAFIFLSSNRRTGVSKATDPRGGSNPNPGHGGNGKNISA